MHRTIGLTVYYRTIWVTDYWTNGLKPKIHYITFLVINP